MLTLKQGPDQEVKGGFSSAAKVGSLTMEPCGVQRHKGIKVLPSWLTVCGVGKQVNSIMRG